MLKKEEISTLASRFSVLKMFSSFFIEQHHYCADIIHRMLLKIISQSTCAFTVSSNCLHNLWAPSYANHGKENDRSQGLFVV